MRDHHAASSFIHTIRTVQYCTVCGTEAHVAILHACLRCITAELVRACEKDWHKACLKCEKCGKTLASGSFLEKEGNDSNEVSLPVRLPGPLPACLDH